jgi:hypothetical protein
MRSLIRAVEAQQQAAARRATAGVHPSAPVLAAEFSVFVIPIQGSTLAFDGIKMDATAEDFSSRSLTDA